MKEFLYEEKNFIFKCRTVGYNICFILRWWSKHTLANPPKAIIKSNDCNKPDEQDDLVSHCCSDIEQFWLKRFSYDGSKDFSASELEWLLEFFGQSSDVDAFLNKLI